LELLGVLSLLDGESENVAEKAKTENLELHVERVCNIFGRRKRVRC